LLIVWRLSDVIRRRFPPHDQPATGTPPADAASVGSVRSWTVDAYLDHLGARHPTPASAAVAALSLAQAAALLAMVARFRNAPGVPERVEELRAAALRLAEADAGLVDEVVAAFALPRSTDAERTRRAAAIADALLLAAGPPADLIPIGAELVGLCERMAEVASGALLGDVAAAADATAAALSISRTNVEADIAPRRDHPDVDRLVAVLDPVDDLLQRAAQIRDTIRRRLTRAS
jgi:formiminotetrahydrofolate cyclodeaminase